MASKIRSTSALRWPVLLLSSAVLVGSYFCLDIPAALKNQIDLYFNYPSEYETLFSMLYSLYATPNVILPFFGGYFVDRYGVSSCLLVFSFLLALGQVIVTIGLYLKSWPVILLGRFVFGLGGENLSVTTSVQVSEWFLGGELAFAFGVNLSIAKLASVFNDFVSPSIASSFGSNGVVAAAGFGALLCVLSLASVFIYTWIENYVDGKTDASYQTVNADDSVQEEKQEEHSEMIEVLKFPMVLWMLFVSCLVCYGCTLPFNNISASLLLERNFFVVPPAGCALKRPYHCELGTNHPNSLCPASEWYQPPLPMGTPTNVLQTACGNFTTQLTMLDVDCNDACWSDGCASKYCAALVKSEAHAAMVMSIPYAMSSVLIPIMGLLVDRYGGRAMMVTVSCVVLVLVHTTLGFTHVGPILPLLGQGFAYALFVSVFWPAVPMVIEHRLTGLAFGVAVSVQNAGCALMPVLASLIYSASGNRYIPNVEILFIFLGATGFFVSLVINYQDYRYHNSTLNLPEQAPPVNVSRIASKSKSGSFSRLLDKVKSRSYNSMDALGGMNEEL